MKIDIVLDGKAIQTETGQTILRTAAENGVRIPTLCFHKDLSPSGNCRMCVVEIQGSRTLQAACVTPVVKDMVIQTNSERVIQDRRLTLGLMMANHTANCSYCDISSDCELQDLVYEYHVDAPAWGIKGTRYRIDSDPNRYIHVDLNKCVLCRRCVQACAEIQVRDVLGIAQRGFGAEIVAGAGTTFEKARCEWCGQCVAYCPTGALSSKVDYGRLVAKAHQVRKVHTTCGFCGLGCQLELVVRRNKIVGVSSHASAPVNGMALCVKGRFEYSFIQDKSRLRKPMVRRYLLDGGKKLREGSGWEWVETDWETALDITAAGLSRTANAHGADALGFLGSGKCLNEENYLLNKLARQVFGTNNVDNLARMEHSRTSDGIRRGLGAGETTNSLRDVARESRAFLVIGSNTTRQHPVFGSLLRRAVRFRGAKLLIIDPADIDLAEFAALHLRNLPGTDSALINGLIAIVLEKRSEDREFISHRTEGFSELEALARRYPPTMASVETGVPIGQLYEAAELLTSNKPTSIIVGKGIDRNGSGSDVAAALVNLQLLLGNFGVPGGGIVHLQGQNNAQGACDMGTLPAAFPGGEELGNPSARAKFASAWGLIPEDENHSGNGALPTPSGAGLSARDMLMGGPANEVRALYVMADDPLSTGQFQPGMTDRLAALEFLIVQDIAASATSEFADVLLPGVSFAEKTGTFTNTERRVQLVQQAIPPVGEARPDWWIISEVAKRLVSWKVVRVPVEATFSTWGYHDTSDIMHEIGALVPAYGGITHERLQAGADLQWPCPSAEHAGTPILHEKSFPRGRASFVTSAFIPPVEDGIGGLKVQ